MSISCGVEVSGEARRASVPFGSQRSNAGHFATTKADVQLYICDVNIPAGNILEISGANGILSHAGGGVQYYSLKYFDEWFSNARVLE